MALVSLGVASTKHRHGKHVTDRFLPFTLLPTPSSLLNHWNTFLKLATKAHALLWQLPPLDAHCQGLAINALTSSNQNSPSQLTGSPLPWGFPLFLISCHLPMGHVCFLDIQRQSFVSSGQYPCPLSLLPFPPFLLVLCLLSLSLVPCPLSLCGK